MAVLTRRRVLGTAAAGLTATLAGGLTACAVRLRTPRSAELSAGLVCCEVTGYQPGEAVARLRAANVIASATPYAALVGGLMMDLHDHAERACACVFIMGGRMAAPKGSVAQAS